MYRLWFEHPPQERAPFVGREPVVCIGRDPSNQLRCQADGVGDRHAAIELGPDGYYVRDLQSANGVRVNGQPVQSRRLDTGDELELGALRLRFEIVHERAAVARSTSLMQAVAVAVVAALMAGELALCVWIFTQTGRPRLSPPRPRSAPSAPSPVLGPAERLSPAAEETPAGSTVAEPAAPAPAIPRPPVLMHMIRIVGLERTVAPDAVTLMIRARAQVGERQVDVAAVAISVQWFSRTRGAGDLRKRETIWVAATQWENFTEKTFSARIPARPEEFGGLLVRTYYRGKLQDEQADPPSLLGLAPGPSPP